MRYISLAELLSVENLPLAESRPATPEALALGIYKPLLLASVAGGRILLGGGSTLRLAEETGVAELAVRELGPLNPVEAAEAAAISENRPGAYELRELVALLHWLESHGCRPSERLRASVDGGKRGLLSQAERAGGLREPARTIVLTGSLTLRHGEMLAALPEELMGSMVSRLEEGSFSVRRELVTMVYEVYRRRFAEDPGIVSRLSEALTGDNPREEIRALRYPDLEEARRTLSTFKDAWTKGKGLILEEPESFEGDRFRLVIPFRSAKELQTRLREADRMAGEVDTITELLG